MYYSQLDAQFKDKKIGVSNTKFASAACYLFSISHLTKRDPLALNEFFIQNGVYGTSDLIDSPKASQCLQMTYEKRIPPAPAEYPCIIEVGDFKTSQHFVYSPIQDIIVDSLDLTPKEKFNPYKIIKSYRIFKPMETENYSVSDGQILVWAMIGHNIGLEEMTQLKAQHPRFIDLFKFLLAHEDFAKNKEKIGNAFELLEQGNQEVVALKNKIEQIKNVVNN